MLVAWTDQRSNGQSGALGVDERFGLLVDAEWHREKSGGARLT